MIDGSALCTDNSGCRCKCVDNLLNMVVLPVFNFFIFSIMHKLKVFFLGDRLDCPWLLDS